MDTHIAACAAQAGPDKTPLAACGVDHGCVQNILPNLNSCVVWVTWSICQLDEGKMMSSLAVWLRSCKPTM